MGLSVSYSRLKISQRLPDGWIGMKRRADIHGPQRMTLDVLGSPSLFSNFPLIPWNASTSMRLAGTRLWSLNICGFEWNVSTAIAGIVRRISSRRVASTCRWTVIFGDPRRFHLVQSARYIFNFSSTLVQLANVSMPNCKNWGNLNQHNC